MIMNVQDEFEGQLRLILDEIAHEHKLDPRALVGRYILRGQKDLSPVTQGSYPIPEGLPAAPRAKTPTAKAPGEKKKGGRKPKFSTPPELGGDLTEEFLRDLTIPLLKDACKMRKIPITGGKDVLVGRIQEHQKNPNALGDKKKGGRKKKIRVPEPEHNHALDNNTHKDCPQCETYGNPMDPGMQEETFEITASPAATEGAGDPAPVAPVAPVGPEAPAAPMEFDMGEDAPAAPKEFDMGEDDLDAQLKDIVSQMNQIEVVSDDEYESDDEDEDPFAKTDYVAELDEED